MSWVKFPIELDIPDIKEIKQTVSEILDKINVTAEKVDALSNTVTSRLEDVSNEQAQAKEILEQLRNMVSESPQVLAKLDDLNNRLDRTISVTEQLGTEVKNIIPDSTEAPPTPDSPEAATVT